VWPPACRATSSADEALNDPEVEAVIVASPTHTHYDIIMKAIARGLPIMAEKPVGSSLQEIDAVFAASAEKGVPLFVAFNRRFDPSWRHAHQQVAAGKIGTPLIMLTTARDNPPPTAEYLKSSQGYYLDAAIHDIDVIRWVLGMEPESVFAYAHAHSKVVADIGDVDVVIISYKFKNGCVATTNLSRISPYGYDQRIEVFGDKGMVQVHNPATTTCQTWDSTGCLAQTNKPSFPERFQEAYVAELEHFYDIVVSGATPLLTHADSRNTYLIAEAARQSQITGKPVTIDYSA